MTLVQEYVVDCCSKMFLTVLSEMPVINEGCFFIRTRLTVLAVFENAGEDGSSYSLIIKSFTLSDDFLFFFRFFSMKPLPVVVVVVVNSSMFFIIAAVCLFSSVV